MKNNDNPNNPNNNSSLTWNWQNVVDYFQKMADNNPFQDDRLKS